MQAEDVQTGEEEAEYYYEEEEGGEEEGYEEGEEEEAFAAAAAPADDEEEEERGQLRPKMTEAEEIAMLESKGWVNVDKITGPPSRMAPRPPPVQEKLAAGKKETWEGVKSDRNWQEDVDLATHSPAVQAKRAGAGHASELAVPEVVRERFDVGARLGPHVLRGIDKKTGQAVALKIAPASAEAVAVLRSLQGKPRVQQLLEEAPGCLVLQLREGGDMFRALAEGSVGVTEADASRLTREVLEGLREVHAQGAAHLDVTPDHVLLDAEGRAWLEGFSLARPASAKQSAPVSGGSIHFQAPEVVFNTAVGPASDLWSVGVLCFCLLTGQLPFPEQHTVKLKVQIKKGIYAPPLHASAAAREFLAALLAVDPTKRPSAEQALRLPFLAAPAAAGAPLPGVKEGLAQLAKR